MYLDIREQRNFPEKTIFLPRSCQEAGFFFAKILPRKVEGVKVPFVTS